MGTSADLLELVALSRPFSMQKRPQTTQITQVEEEVKGGYAPPESPYYVAGKHQPQSPDYVELEDELKQHPKTLVEKMKAVEREHKSLEELYDEGR